jgi:hypothetical protein
MRQRDEGRLEGEGPWPISRHCTSILSAETEENFDKFVRISGTDHVSNHTSGMTDENHEIRQSE